MVGFILTYDNILSFFIYICMLPTTIINVYMHFHKYKKNKHIHNQTHTQSKQFYIKPNLFFIFVKIQYSF
jgi:hypothetical protein